MIVSVLKHSEGNYLIIDRKDRVTSFRSIEEAVDFYQSMYRHENYTQSISSTIHYMLFDIRIVELTEEEILELIGPPPWTPVLLSSLAGSIRGIELMPGKGEGLVGVRPSLLPEVEVVGI